MAIGEILEVRHEPKIREDAYFVTYIETELPKDDVHDGVYTVLVAASNAQSAVDKLNRVYKDHYGSFFRKALLKHN